MSFQKYLKDIADKTEHLSGLVIADEDGIVVEEYPIVSGLEMASLVAEYGAILKSIDQAGLSSDLGVMSECSILTEKAVLVIRKISSDYFLLLALPSEKNFGKGRFYTRIAADALALEFNA